ncbi:MAG TPA: hypothetical protein VHE61_16900 [Opitutaceae bacterium]|nr:hypothetical protein [Opitutaceae bacterium]
MIDQQSKNPVTIEDLLRFKRAERPAPEFWDEFDRELRAKQLAALVEKRPWWRRFPRALAGTARYHLPLGATAVLALTLLSVRDYQPALPSSPADINLGPVAATPMASTVEVAPSVAPAETDVVPRSESESVAVETPAAVPAPVEASTTPTDVTAPGALTRMVPMLAVQDPTSASADLRPSLRSIAENRAAAEAMLGTTSGFENRVLPARAMPQEPLAQMTNPAEVRRSRFAAAFASAALDTSTAASARVARRLSDEQLYDSIHRFGASGNTVSFRF